MYFVQFTEKSLKELKKLTKNKFEKYKESITKSLQENPTYRGKYFGRSSKTNLLYFERKIYTDGGLRFFYTIIDGVIIVADIEYQGQVMVDGVSNKNNQKQISKRLGL